MDADKCTLYLKPYPHSSADALPSTGTPCQPQVYADKRRLIRTTAALHRPWVFPLCACEANAGVPASYPGWVAVTSQLYSKVFVHGFVHGDNVFGRCTELNVMGRAGVEPAAFAHGVQHTFNFVFHLVAGCIG